MYSSVHLIETEFSWQACEPEKKIVFNNRYFESCKLSFQILWYHSFRGRLQIPIHFMKADTIQHRAYNKFTLIMIRKFYSFYLKNEIYFAFFLLLPLLKSHYLNNLYFFHVTKSFRVRYNFPIEKGQIVR